MRLSTVQPFARTALVLVLVGLGAWTLRTFLPALIWAAILAIAIWPLYERIEAHGPRRAAPVLAPLVLTVAVGLVFVAPLLIAVLEAAREARELLQWVRETEASGIPVPEWLSGASWGQAAAEWWRDNLSHPFAASEVLDSLHRGSTLLVARELGAQVAHRAVLFVFTLLTLFFLLRDGRALTTEMRRASERLFGPRGERVGLQMIASVHGTLSGLVLVGLGEGLLLGIAYWIARVPHPVLLGLLTAVAAMIPFGAPLIFVVAALLLLAQGDVGGALGIVVFGLVVLVVADHVIRPVLIGGATKLPFVWVLFGILGGVEAWGLLGLFLGPAIMASLVLLWRELVTTQTTAERTGQSPGQSAVARPRPVD